MAKVTINDVAKLAGVSIKTVSRVVNVEPNVRQATREKVETAIAELNYRPNLSARNLASARSYLVVLVYDDPSVYEVPSAGFIIAMQEGALRACRATNHELLIHPCNYRVRGLKTELRTLIEQARPDGIVLAAPLSNMPKVVGAIEATGTNLVTLSPGSMLNGANAVVTNDQEVSAEMTTYLASLGHQRIAFIKGNRQHKAVQNRFLGYKAGLKTAGLDFDDSLVVSGDNSIGSGERAAERLLSLKRRPSAIFSANDDMAAGVMRVAYRYGLEMPDDLSVAGFDDNPLAQQVYPALTSIRQPLSIMTERAVQKLVAGFSKRSDSTDVVPASIVIRDSTGPAPKPSRLKRILSR